MTLTVYSFLMSIVWFGLFSVLLLVLRRKEAFVLSFGLLPMLCLVIATLLRVFLPLTREQLAQDGQENGVTTVETWKEA